MSAEMDHCRGLLAPFVLGACPRAEATGVARHLAECDSCSREARRLSEGVKGLHADVTPVAPGPWVKDRVMARVRADAALFDAARQPRTGSAAGIAGPARPWSRRLRAPTSAPIPIAALASVLLLVAACGALVASALRSDPGAIRVVHADVDRKLAPRTGSGTLELRDDHARLRVDGLPSPGRGRVYQVWARAAGRAPRPANTTFDVDARGAAAVDVPALAMRADELLVTSEPSGGSPIPTRLPVLRIDV